MAQFGSGSRVILSILKEKLKILVEKNNFLFKEYIIYYRYKNKMSPKEIFTQMSLLTLNLCLKSYIFCLHFILYLHVRIRIRIPNTDLDPEGS